MPFNFTIPRTNAPALDISIGAGEIIFVLGANGSGKSCLMHRLYTAAPQNTRRISAHRRTWFESNAITLSPHQKQQTDINIHNNDTTPAARWTDPYSAQRASIAVYDLVDAENVRARAITAAVDGKNFDLAKLLSKKDAPIKVISELLQISNIPIEIVVEDNQQVVAKKMAGSHIVSPNFPTANATRF
jgi:ABC-type transport system involved in cytochrome c biogenesis ATPase subunit